MCTVLYLLSTYLAMFKMAEVKFVERPDNLNIMSLGVKEKSVAGKVWLLIPRGRKALVLKIIGQFFKIKVCI